MPLRSVAILLLAVPAIFAQSPTATLVGRVVDSTGALVVGASLEARNSDNGESHKGTTDDKGEFTIANLAPGPYDVFVTKEGFRTVHETNIVLEIEQEVRFEFKLEPGTVTQSVEVTAAVTLVNTENGAKGEVMTSLTIVEMPLNGRDFSDLALLVPGVSPNAPGGLGSAFAINGARADNTNFIIDGFNDQNPRGGAAQARPNIDALEEFKMQTSNYSPEYGRLAGGVMNMVTKTGGNRYHGVLFEFLRNDLFDARNFFDSAKGELRQNQFGGTLSGPLSIPKVYDARNRTFFLFSWESYRQVQGTSKLGVVPTLAERGGDFTQIGPIADPLASGTCPGAASGTKGGCFPNNTIPASRQNPVALKADAFNPLPNVAGQLNNLHSYTVAPNYWDSWLMKFDERVSTKDTFSFRYTKRYNRSYGPYANANSKDSNNTGLWGQHVDNHQTLAGLTYTRMFSPTLINEARLGFTRTVEHDLGIDQGTDFNAQLGIKGATTDPLLVGFPLIVVTGLQQIGGGSNLPVAFYVNNFDPGETLTWVRSGHLLKFGAEVLHTQFTQPYWNNNRGTYTFTGSWTGQPFADFLLGMMNSDSRQIGTTTNYLRTTNYGFFGQDEWKATGRLTLTFGMRYEIPKPPEDKYGRYTNFVPGLNKLVIGSDKTLAGSGITFSNPNMAETAAQAGIPSSLVYTSLINLAPRFGFAWRPFGGSRTVVRGGFGIFYGNQVQNPIRNNLANAFPFAISQTTNRNASQPNFLTLSSPFPNKPNLNGNLSSLTIDGYELHAPTPYLSSWNFTIEREIGFSSAIEVSYVGSKGSHLPIQVNINQPYRSAQTAPNFPVPYPGYGTINYISFEGNSSYNAATITWRRRFNHGFFYTLNYTHGKSIDNASQINGSSDGGYSGLQDARNLGGDRGRSDWDIGNQFTESFSWTAPFKKNPWVRGWQIAGTGRLYTGAPFTPTVTNVNLALGEANRPNRIATGTLPNPDANRWFNVAAFPPVPQGAFTFGDSGRNILDGPGRIEINITLYKNFVLREKSNLQFRWETFNVLNHANLGLPVNAVNAPNAGTIVTADNGRLMQFGLRYTF